jgi:hypothetical protein
LLFGLSISNLQTKQTPQKCLEALQHFSPSKITKPLVGANFVYSDTLYLYSDESAPKLKHSSMTQIVAHKHGLQNLIEKKFIDFQIQHAFNYMVWSQFYVGIRNFGEYLANVQKIYQHDEKFQQYLKEDCNAFNREYNENQINFFLEESLITYFASKNKAVLPNDFINNEQKWVLLCYEGKPIKTIIYLYKLNPFNLDWPENPYQNAWYDLSANKLIEFDRVDLNTYTYTD